MAPVLCILDLILYLKSNIDINCLTSFKVKLLVANFKPLPILPPSSIIQIAKAKGDKN